jgi:hypothetical protein
MSPQQAPWFVVGVVMAVLLLAVLAIFFLLVLRHAQNNRNLLHTERMKALELGQPLGFTEYEKLQEKHAHNAFWIAFWVGAGVPISAAWAAAYSMPQASAKDLGVTLAMWISVAAISTASVICATVLMMKARRAAQPNAKTPLSGPERSDAS